MERLLLGPAQSDDITGRIAIVGTGPAGLALATSLESAGLDVVVLESGGEVPSAFTSALAEAADAPPLHARLQDMGSRRFGGASWTWGGRCVAYDAIDFEPRPRAEAPGWPIEMADATSAADRAALFLGIGSARFELPPLPMASGSVRATLERWCSQPRVARLHARAIRRSQAVRVHLGLTCTGAEIDGNGRVGALLARAAGGADVRVVADAYVIAAGGIETARLLLWAFERLPEHARPPWLGRGYMGHLSGRIADILMAPEAMNGLDYRRDGDACFVRSKLVLDRNALRSEGLLNIAFHIDNPAIGDPRHGSAALSALALALAAPGLGHTIMPGPLREVLLGSPSHPGDGIRHLANVVRAPWDAATFGWLALGGRMSRPRRPGIVARNRAGRYALRFSGEQLARLDSRVRLSGDVDALGLPRVIIAPRIDPFDVECVLRAHAVLAAELDRSGTALLEYYVAPEDRAASVLAQSGDGYHQIGLARMGHDRATSVVDRNARVHGLANLYVAGSAVFPTSSHANPTFMIVCQALRLADHLARTLDGRALPARSL